MVYPRRTRRRISPPTSPKLSIKRIERYDEDLKIDNKLKSIFLLSMEREISQCILGYPPIQPHLQFEEFVGGMLEEEEVYEKYQKGGGWSMRRGYNSSNQTTKIWIDEQKGVLCARFPYRSEVIDAIRNKIPKGKKSWNPELSIWEFSIECIDEVVEILSSTFSDLINLVDLTQSPQSGGTNPKDLLLSILDKDDLSQIYRLLARKYHPDVNQGDGEMMSRINVLFKIK